MKSDLEHSFVKQLQENQNIIHKICRLYTEDEDAHKTRTGQLAQAQANPTA